MTQTLVIALGGNAILTDDPTAEGQKLQLQRTADALVAVVKAGNRLVITHGNGPQVGNILLQQAASDSAENPAMPLDTAVAMTQGSIGYWLQNALAKSLVKENISKKLATIVTQVVVDANDPAFAKPTKPIGPFITEEMAKQLAEETGDIYVEDAGRGYRKVVPSPKPIAIVEEEVVKTLLDNDVIVISGGGGGIPVRQTSEGYEGLEAVIDKDFAAAKLAELVDADALIILTAVDNVAINFNQENEEKLQDVTVSQLKKYIQENQFAAGSMLPKVEAAIQFAEKKPGSAAYITSLQNLDGLIHEGSGTVIRQD